MKKRVKKTYKWLKLVIKAFTLSSMLYGIYVASNKIDGITIILATLMIITWVLQLLFEIVIQIFEDKKDLLVAGWNKDIDNLKKPVTAVNNFIKRVKGQEIVEIDNIDNKEIKILERKINKSNK